MIAPFVVDLGELQKRINETFPSAIFHSEDRHATGAWRFTVELGEAKAEFLWFPTMGFGVSDLSRPDHPGDNPFIICDNDLRSIDEAVTYFGTIDARDNQKV